MATTRTRSLRRITAWRLDLANARLTWGLAGGVREGALALTNAFDKLYYVSVFDLLASSGAKYATPGRPRGGSLSVRSAQWQF